MHIPAFVLTVLALLAIVAPARADLVAAQATVTYNSTSKLWDFTSATDSGFMNIVEKSVAKTLTRLKATGSLTCVVEYDTDSRIEALNGKFFSVFRVSKCT